jgi:hypothetical protein
MAGGASDLRDAPRENQWNRNGRACADPGAQPHGPDPVDGWGCQRLAPLLSVPYVDKQRGTVQPGEQRPLRVPDPEALPLKKIGGNCPPGWTGAC